MLDGSVSSSVCAANTPAFTGVYCAYEDGVDPAGGGVRAHSGGTRVWDRTFEIADDRG